MHNSTGPVIGFSPLSHTAAVFGQTFRIFASCDWQSPSRNRICLNLLAVIVILYQKYSLLIKSKVANI